MPGCDLELPEIVLVNRDVPRSIRHGVNPRAASPVDSEPDVASEGGIVVKRNIIALMRRNVHRAVAGVCIAGVDNAYIVIDVVCYCERRCSGVRGIIKRAVLAPGK